MQTEIRTEGLDISKDLKAGKVHFVAYAHLGFSPLHAVACMSMNLPRGTAEAFVARVNDTDEVGTLFPKMYISAMPKRFGRTELPWFREFSYEEFRRVLLDVVRCNEEAVKSPCVVMDLTCSLFSQRTYLERFFEELKDTHKVHTTSIVGIIDRD